MSKQVIQHVYTNNIIKHIMKKCMLITIIIVKIRAILLKHRYYLYVL